MHQLASSDFETVDRCYCWACSESLPYLMLVASRCCSPAQGADDLSKLRNYEIFSGNLTNTGSLAAAHWPSKESNPRAYSEYII